MLIVAMMLAALICPQQTHIRPGYIADVAHIAQWLYPDPFADLNHSSISQECLEQFRVELPDRLLIYPASEP